MNIVNRIIVIIIAAAVLVAAAIVAASLTGCASNPQYFRSDLNLDEPATLAVLALGALAVLRRSRR